MRLPLKVSLALATLLFVLSFILGNTEFVIYAVTALVLVAILYKTDQTFHYSPYALWGFAVWIALHSLGGLASINGVRVYDYMLLNMVGEPYSILKYDQVVHFYTYIVIGSLLCSVVESITSAKASHVTVGIVVVLAAVGVGALNEIIEFLPVVFFDSPGPGGYHNTVIDLITNALGAMAAVFFTYRNSN